MRRMISDTLQTYLKAVKTNYPDPSNIGGKTNLEVDNITAMTTAQINDLKAGDIVLKKTGDQRHTYVVTYKEENKGICMSYFDAGYLETVSYDYVTNAWVYNSTDVVNILEDYALKSELPAEVSGTNDGTNWTSLTVGNDTYGFASGGGGSTLYRHYITISYTNLSDFSLIGKIKIDIISSSNTYITSVDTIKTILNGGSYSMFGYKGIAANGVWLVNTDWFNIIGLETDGTNLQGVYLNSSHSETYVNIPSDALINDTVYTL